MDKRKIGKRIAELRTQAGLSQLELAGISHLGANAIHRLENGEQNATIDTLNAVAHALKTTTDEIIGDEMLGPSQSLHQAAEILEGIASLNAAHRAAVLFLIFGDERYLAQLPQKFHSYLKLLKPNIS